MIIFFAYIVMRADPNQDKEKVKASVLTAVLQVSV